MEYGKVFVAALLLCLGKLRVAAGLREDICIEKGPNAETACENIYIWEKEREDFVLASSGKGHSVLRNDLDALRGKTVRVIADNMLPYITSSNHSRKLGGYLGNIWHIIQKVLGFNFDSRSCFAAVSNYTITLYLAKTFEFPISSAQKLVYFGTIIAMAQPIFRKIKLHQRDTPYRKLFPYVAHVKGEGRFSANGTIKWRGVISNITSMDYDNGVDLMIKKEADIMLAAAIEKRGQINIEYSQPYFYNWYHLYIKRPEPKASSNSYLKIFSMKLWLATLFLIIIITTTLWLSARVSHKIDRKQSRLSIMTCMLVVCSGFLNQGYEVRLSTYSARMQIFLALVIGFLLYSAMNAVLVARLANFEVQLPFSDLNDIRIRKTHSLCLRSNSFVYNNFTFLMNTTKIILPEWKGVLNGAGCLDINDQANLAKTVCNDGVIFLENRVVMSTIIKSYELPCTITFPPEKYFMKPNSFIVLKNFQQKKLINSMIKKLKSTGILSRLENKWVEKYEPEKANAGTLPQVTIQHISGLLELYGVAIFFSLILLALETLRCKYYDRRMIPFKQ